MPLGSLIGNKVFDKVTNTSQSTSKMNTTPQTEDMILKEIYIYIYIYIYEINDNRKGTYNKKSP